MRAYECRRCGSRASFPLRCVGSLSTFDHRPEPMRYRPPTQPELDSLSLLGNPHLDRDTETVEWLAGRESALRASKGVESHGTV